MGHRLSVHGEGTWSFPGGHLEFGESFADCARREVLEETGLIITEPEFVTCTNDVFVPEKKHYITIYMKAAWTKDEPQVREPNKMVRWEWFAWDDLPTPLFLPQQNLINTGFHP